MGWIRGGATTATFDATAAIDVTATTHLNGVVREVYLAVSGGTPSTSSSVKVVSVDSTRKVLCYVTDPSTLGEYYYPARATWSTSATVASTYGLAYPVMHQEQARVIASGTSGIDNKTLTVKIYVE